LAEGHGTAMDRSHLFIAAARTLEIPARYVSGYVFDPERDAPSTRVHAWAEAYVGNQLGWIGFDPTLDMCPTEAHVRVATSLDHLDASPIRATHHGGFGLTTTSRVVVREAKSRARRHVIAE
jgi:transglutaminase-like putative cysteine protease